MAENKQSFVLYTDLLKVVEKLILQDRENNTNYAGELFYHILLYVNDKEPMPINFIVELAFEPIKCQLKRDLRKYELTIENKSNGGRLGNLKRWNNDLYLRVSNREITLEEAEKIAESRKVSHSDKIIASVADTVTDTVTDTVNDINKKKEISPPENLIFRKIKNNFLIPNEECKKLFLEDSLHCHRLTQNLSINQTNLKYWLDQFFIEQETKGFLEKSLLETKSHFGSWLPIKLKQNKENTFDVYD